VPAGPRHATHPAHRRRGPASCPAGPIGPSPRLRRSPCAGPSPVTSSRQRLGRSASGPRPPSVSIVPAVVMTALRRILAATHNHFVAAQMMSKADSCPAEVGDTGRSRASVSGRPPSRVSIPTSQTSRDDADTARSHNNTHAMSQRSMRPGDIVAACPTRATTSRRRSPSGHDDAACGIPGGDRTPCVS